MQCFPSDAFLQHAIRPLSTTNRALERNSGRLGQDWQEFPTTYEGLAEESTEAKEGPGVRVRNERTLSLEVEEHQDNMLQGLASRRPSLVDAPKALVSRRQFLPNAILGYSRKVLLKLLFSRREFLPTSLALALVFLREALHSRRRRQHMKSRRSSRQSAGPESLEAYL